MAGGLTEARFFTLRTSFFACPTIDKYSNLRFNSHKTTFCSEVAAWLDGELSQEDRKNIFGRENLPYRASYAIYRVAKRFREDYHIINRRKTQSELRANQRAASAADGHLVPATSATSVQHPSVISNVSPTGLVQEPNPPHDHKYLPAAGQSHEQSQSASFTAPSVEAPIEHGHQYPEPMLAGIPVSKIKEIIQLAMSVRDQAGAVTANSPESEREAVFVNYEKLQELLRSVPGIERLLSG